MDTNTGEMRVSFSTASYVNSHHRAPSIRRTASATARDRMDRKEAQSLIPRQYGLPLSDPTPAWRTITVNGWQRRRLAQLAGLCLAFSLLVLLIKSRSSDEPAES